MTTPQVPDGIPSLLRPRQVAAVLNLNPSTVNGWLRKGVIPAQQPQPGMWRVARAEDVALFAHRYGITPDWEAALE